MTAELAMTGFICASLATPKGGFDRVFDIARDEAISLVGDGKQKKERLPRCEASCHREERRDLACGLWQAEKREIAALRSQ
jgi:hypothetical protein